MPSEYLVNLKENTLMFLFFFNDSSYTCISFHKTELDSFFFFLVVLELLLIFSQDQSIFLKMVIFFDIKE